MFWLVLPGVQSISTTTAAGPQLPAQLPREELPKKKNRGQKAATSQIYVWWEAAPWNWAALQRDGRRGAGPEAWPRRAPKAAIVCSLRVASGVSALRERGQATHLRGLLCASSVLHLAPGPPGGDIGPPLPRPASLSHNCPSQHHWEPFCVMIFFSFPRRPCFTQVSLHLEEFSFKSFIPGLLSRVFQSEEGSKGPSRALSPALPFSQKTQDVKIVAIEELNAHLPDVWYYGNIKSITFETLRRKSRKFCRSW